MRLFSSGTIAYLGCGLVLALSACATNPYHGQIVDNRSDPVDIELWATAPNTTVTVECGAGILSTSFTHVKTFTSSTTALGSTQKVYAAGGHVTLPSSCWDIYHGLWATRMRFKQGSNSMLVFDQEGLDCLFDSIAGGELLHNAGLACALRTSSNTFAEQIIFRARN